MPIDHARATEENLIERYLLREMPAAEAEEFELHFFECEECAAAVETGQALLVNGRTIGAEDPAPEPGQSAHELPRSLWNSLVDWWNKPLGLISVATSLLLGGLAFYQGAVVIPGLRQARVLPVFQLIGASRGEPSIIEIPRDAVSFAISADVPPDAHFAQYVCKLSFDGHAVFELNSSAPAAGQPITILVPARDLHAGQFALTISGAEPGGKRQDRVAEFSFDLRFRP
jgi:hypothetical protein